MLAFGVTIRLGYRRAPPERSKLALSLRRDGFLIASALTFDDSIRVE